MAKLEITDLCKSYKNFTLGPINLQIDPGTVHALIGSNGSGKSTMFRCIMGTILKDRGKIKVNGILADDTSGKWKQAIGYVGDYTPLFEGLSGAENLKAFSVYYENWSNETLLSLAERFSLDLNKTTKNYSTGQRTIFAIIYALAHGSTLLLLDEPTVGLDPLARDIFMEVLYEQIQNESLSIIYATHYVSEIESFADHLILMNSGNIIKHGIKEDLVQDWRKITFRNDNKIIGIPSQISLKACNQEHEVISDDYQKTLVFLEKTDSAHIQISRLSIEQICVQFLKNNRKMNHD